MNAQWFDVDRNGLADLLARKGKAWALFELVQNAFDAQAHMVTVEAEPVPGAPYVRLTVTDDSSEGWLTLDDAYTMFAKSRRASDPNRRGRFNVGEKLVLSCCRSAVIRTMSGTLTFDDTGRSRSKSRTPLGTQFEGEVRMTRDELAQFADAALQIIPPAGTTLVYNGETITRGEPLAVFEAKLPTEYAGDDGTMRRTQRVCHVEAFDAAGGPGGILEMGIPVCDADWPWLLNVHQKIPVGIERDSVTDAFRRALQVAAVNTLADLLSTEAATESWCTDAIADSRAAAPAVKAVVQKRFGERAVIATPGDPQANATAEASGCTVVHGGALPAGAWANVRKADAMPARRQPGRRIPQRRAMVSGVAQEHRHADATQSTHGWPRGIGRTSQGCEGCTRRCRPAARTPAHQARQLSAVPLGIAAAAHPQVAVPDAD